MPKKSKKPKRTESPKSASKQPAYLENSKADDGHYSWRFGKMDMAGPFSWASISDKDLKDVWKRMGAIEAMSLAELLKTRSHPILVSEICKDARNRLPEIYLDDLDELWSFRLGGKPRFWCIKYGSTYALLWWDPEHKIYPVDLPNT